jgi:hypothetical protein
MPLVFRAMLFLVGVPGMTVLLWNMYRNYQEDRPVSSKVADHPAGSFMYYFYYVLFAIISVCLWLSAACLPFVRAISDR